MLYIASALASTAVSHSLLLERDADDISEAPELSLVLAKGNRLEVHDVGPAGLTERCELDVWGQIVGLAKAPWNEAQDAHFLVLTDAPLSRLMLLAYDVSAASPKIRTVSCLTLSPPSRSSRHTEFFTGLVTCPEHNLIIASLWTGVLSVASIGYATKKGSKKDMGTPNSQGLIELKDSFNLNIKEHNLVSLTYIPTHHPQPVLAFLSLSATRSQVIQIRSLMSATQLLTDLTQTTTVSMDICPAARHLIGLPSGLLVVGDEFSLFHDIQQRDGSKSSVRLGSSPEAVAKKRKGSVGGSLVSTFTKSDVDGGDVWDFKTGFRLRQGFGNVLATEVVTASAEGGTVLLGDEFGKISALSYTRGGTSDLSGSSGMSQVTPLGNTSPPTSITYIDSGYVFVGSHCGDSQIILIEPSTSTSGATASTSAIMSSPESNRSSPRKGKAKARSSDSFDVPDVTELENGKERAKIIEQFMNLAPVNDFCVIEENGGGVSKILTASGASTSNSLRVVRSGVGLDTKLTVQGLADVQSMWPLSSGNADTGCDDLLLVSTSCRTLLFAITNSGRNVVENTDAQYAKLVRDQPTLSAGQIDCAAGTFVQITSQAAALIGASDATVYNTASEIVTSSIQGSVILIGERAKVVKSLDPATLAVKAETITAEEPSAIAISLNDTLPSGIVAVGSWDGSLALHSAQDLALISITPALASGGSDSDVDMDGAAEDGPSSNAAKLPSYAATLAFHAKTPPSEQQALQLLVGLGNGRLITFGLESTPRGSIALSEPRTTTIGPLPVRLTPARSTSNRSAGLEQDLILAISDRLTLLYDDHDRLAHSSISRPGLSAAVAFCAPGLGSCLVIAAEAGLTFSTVTSLKKLHVQKTDLGDKSPMKICYNPSSNYLGIGILQSTLDTSTGDLLELGYFELRDVATLDSLAQYLLEPTESVTALEHVIVEGVTYFAVGTAFDAAEGNMNSVTRGRLLLLEAIYSFVDRSWSIKSQGELKVPGPVFAVQPVRDYLAVASQNKVTIYKPLKSSSSAEIVFNETSSWGSAFVAEHLSLLPTVAGEAGPPATLIVGDSMRSISMIHVSEVGVLEKERRDLSTHWITGMHPIRDGGQAAVISDSNYNIMTLRLGEQVENAARFGLHEHLTRFRPGSIAPPAAVNASDATPDVIFSTAAGRIGIIGELGAASTRILDDLQRNLEQFLKGPGDLDYSGYRRARLELGSKPSVGFVDGDFVQRFLSLSVAEQEQVLSGRGSHDAVIGSNGKGVDRAEVLRILEAVGQLH